jgi:hypothetical protein
MKRLIGVFAIVLAFGISMAAQSNYPDQDRDRDRSYAGQQQPQMSPQDQQAFNNEYQKWQSANARHDRDDVAKHAHRMQDIMARYNIPPDTPFYAVAQANGYAANGYGPDNEGRQYQRFSPDDQRRFDHIYDHWLESRRKHDRDDIQKDERKMQDLMARYNIPPDVPFDELATPRRR